MLITDKNILKNYVASKCLWVGIPSIEVTKKGRTFLTFYSGGVKEEIGNYVMLVMSDDGKNFSEPIAVCFEEGYRCFDPCLWIDPLGRLWLTWSRCPEDGVFGAVCENPDADEIVFGEEFFIGNNIMMNKPTVLSGGEWVFPIAVWNYGVPVPGNFDSDITPKGSFAYVSYDRGKTFQKLGYADVKDRTYDEHMFLEKEDGRIRCFVRTTYGIGAADSYDGGLHWGESFDTGYGGPCSRFHIRRLESGRVLLINHCDCEKDAMFLGDNGRKNLTAMLSEDDGETFPYRLLLDERNCVAYPDVAVDNDGMIHITYDRERGAFCSSIATIMGSAREILTACISEEDILKGCIVNKKSYLKNVAYKLTNYDGDLKNPCNEKELFSDDEYVEYLDSITEDKDEIITNLFEIYGKNCANLHSDDAKKLDSAIEKYKTKKDVETLQEIVYIVRKSTAVCDASDSDVVQNVCSYVKENFVADCSIEEIADKLHLSVHYMNYIFEKKTGISVADFKMTQRAEKAKQLIRSGNCDMVDIAVQCGFEDEGGFNKIFTEKTGISPQDYCIAVRKLSQ